MKKRILTITLVLAAASALLLGGCGKRSDEINNVSGASAEIAATSTADAAATLNSTWYDYDGNYLTGFTVTIESGSEVILSREIDENGMVPEFSVPTNTKLKATITNASGAELASSRLLFSVSPDYTQMVIIPPEDGVSEVQLPSGATAINISLFVNKDGEVACSSSSRNRSSAANTITDSTGDTEDSSSAEEESESTESESENTDSESETSEGEDSNE